MLVSFSAGILVLLSFCSSFPASPLLPLGVCVCVWGGGSVWVWVCCCCCSFGGGGEGGKEGWG